MRLLRTLLAAVTLLCALPLLVQSVVAPPPCEQRFLDAGAYKTDETATVSVAANTLTLFELHLAQPRHGRPVRYLDVRLADACAAATRAKCRFTYGVLRMGLYHSNGTLIGDTAVIAYEQGYASRLSQVTVNATALPTVGNTVFFALAVAQDALVYGTSNNGIAGGWRVPHAGAATMPHQLHLSPAAMSSRLNYTASVAITICEPGTGNTPP